MNDMTAPRADFTHMKEGTGEDWQIIAKSFGEFSKGLPDRIITHLRLLEGDFGGFKIDRFQHCLKPPPWPIATAKMTNMWSAHCCTTSAIPSAPSTTRTWPPCC